MDFRWDRLLSILKRWESCLTKKKDYMPPENATKAGWRHLFFCQKSVSEELLYLSGKQMIKMREIVFKMERPGLVEVGQEVDVSESVTPVNVNYMIEPAVAMSGLFRFTERLKSKKGIVKDIIQNDRGYYVTVEFDE